MNLRANCKINIGLDVLRRREDGFHELETLMYPVLGLYDEIWVEESRSQEIVFRGEGLLIDCPAEDNLCVKAAQLMCAHFGLPSVEIRLNKCVPFGAGLGGGSSDCVCVILAMNEIFSLNLSEEKLISLAASLGSDTAFFVRNRSQLCKGRGEIMQDLDINLQGYSLVLIKPETINVSTREAYGGIKPSIPSKPLEERLLLPIESWRENVGNAFEKHIFEIYPKLAEIKQELYNSNAVYASMSGSGSTIFGIFACKAHEIKLKPSLKALSPYIFKI